MSAAHHRQIDRVHRPMGTNTVQYVWCALHTRHSTLLSSGTGVHTCAICVRDLRHAPWALRGSTATLRCRLSRPCSSIGAPGRLDHLEQSCEAEGHGKVLERAQQRVPRARNGVGRADGFERAANYVQEPTMTNRKKPRRMGPTESLPARRCAHKSNGRVLRVSPGWWWSCLL